MTATRGGCPTLHLDLSGDRPAGTWGRELTALGRKAPIWWNETGGYWVITAADITREIFQDPVLFTNDSITPGDPDPSYKWIPSNVNPPQHVQYRQILSYAFSPKAVAGVADATRRYCREAVEAVVSRGRCEYVKELAGGFPTRVFELVDLPWADAGRFTTWADTIFDGFFTTPAAMTAFTEVREYFTEWVTQTATAPARSDRGLHQPPAGIEGRRPAPSGRRRAQHPQPADARRPRHSQERTVVLGVAPGHPRRRSSSRGSRSGDHPVRH